MTFSTTTNRKDYVGNGVTTAFSVPFRFFNDADLVVIQADTNGNETTLILGTHYTVSGAGSYSPGTVNMVTAVPNLYTLTIKRIVALTQESSIRGQGAYFPEIHEDALDKLTAIAQQQEEEISRVIQVPESAAGGQVLDAPVEGTVLGWVGGRLRNLASATAQLAVNLLDSSNVALGDALVAVKKTGCVATTLHAFNENRELNVLTDLGVDNTGTTDCTSLVQGAMNTGNTLYFPAGTYKLTTLVCTVAGQKIYGAGPGSVLLANDTTKPLFDVRADKVSIHDIRINGTATAVAASHYGVFTDAAFPAVGISIERVVFSGANSGVGLGHGVKFDTGCNYGRVIGCSVERLWGAIGSGYGVLVGKCTGIQVCGNNFTATSGRGRHAVYFSAGCQGCVASGNTVTGFDYEGMTLNAYGYSATQNANTDCVFSENVVTACGNAFSPGSTSGGISIFGSALACKIINNTVAGCPCCGIYLESVVTLNVAWVTATAYIRGSARSNGGVNYVCTVAHTSGTFATDLAAGKWAVDSTSTVIEGNVVESNTFTGVDIKGFSDGLLSLNIIRKNGTSGTSNGIRLISNGTFSSNNWSLVGNQSTGSAQLYAFEINATAPIPTGTILDGNYFPVCATGDLNLNGAALRIDNENTWVVLTDPGTTGNWSPVIGNGNRYRILNAQTNTIVNLLGGHDGQQVTLLFQTANAITFSLSNAYLAGGAPFVSTANDTLTVVKQGSNWFEVSRSVN